MYIKRDIEAKISAYLEAGEEHSNVLLVQGARQVGKTATCKQVLSQLQSNRRSLSINLEERPDIKLQIDQSRNFSEFTILLQTALGFEHGQNSILFIDEAQESRELGRFVRFMKENWSHTKCILTGSSMSKIFDGETRVPVGRYESIVVRPCSFREFLRAKNLESIYDSYLKRESSASLLIHNQLLTLFDEYMQVGGLPAAVVANQEHKDYRSVQSLILASQRDDFYRKERLKEHLFLDAMQAVSKQLGNPSNLKHVANAYREATQIIEALKKWNLVHEVEQTGSLPTQNFHGKWYLYDLGILSLMRLNALPALSLLNTTDEILRTPLGGIVENAALLQLQTNELTSGHLSITGWKKNNKQPIEVDFVAKMLTGRQEKLLPVEVKASHQITSHHLSNLKHYLEFSRARAGVMVALERPRTVKVEAGTIEIVPIYCDLGPSIFVS